MFKVFCLFGERHLRALLPDDRVKHCLLLRETAQLFSRVAVTIYTPTSQQMRVPFLVPSPHQHWEVSASQLGHGLTGVKWHHILNLELFNDIQCPASFHMSVCLSLSVSSVGFLLIFWPLLTGWSAFLVLRFFWCILESPSLLLKDFFLFMC